MIKIDIFSGFLGAGKTTLIKKLIKEAYTGEKVVLIENEFGEIGVDGGFLKEAGIEITEMNSGCICCSLVGDFAAALRKVAAEFHPDRILIEPSGVGKLSDVIKAVQRANVPDSVLDAFCTVVDAKKCRIYLKNFGEFFLDQVKNAGCIVLSHTSDPAKTEEAAALLKEQTSVTVITTDWDALDGKEILLAMQNADSLKAELERLAEDMQHDGEEEHHHHHHDDEDEEEHHHHDEDEDEEEHHHDEDEDEEEHHHDEDEGEHLHHHHHHHGHDADEVFTSWGIETSKRFTKAQIEDALAALDSGEYGQVLRAKGYVNGEDGWIYFDFVPGEPDLRTGAPAVTGRLCVIGCQIDEERLKTLFLG